MINKEFLEEYAELFPEYPIRLQEPMKEHTTFRVGGNAGAFISIQSTMQLQDILKLLKRYETPFYVIGNGSNLLVSDAGYPGVILEIGEGMNGITRNGNCLLVQAGAYLSAIAKYAMREGLGGLEFASGIPGSLGGAVVMNAGAYDGEMKQVIQSVTLLDQDGCIWELKNEDMEFGYRTSIAKQSGQIVLGAVLCLQPGKQEDILAKMNDFAGRRKEKQPLEYPSAGSTFKRPEGYFAGKLIMDAGLRGFQYGGAQVSEKHCGFVINKDQATAADIYHVIQTVSDTVQKTFGVLLEPEVIFLGEFK